jgi:hypothetical protein
MCGYKFPALLFALVVLTPPPALAIHRCTANGAVTYSDMPCGAGTAAASLPPAASVDATQAQQAQRKLARQQDELRRMVVERERREAAEQSARARAEAGRQAHAKRCKLMEMKLDWSEEDAARAGVKQQAQARKAARRKKEEYDLQCAGG